MTSLYSRDSFFGFILADYQTGIWEKYLVTGDWSQSTDEVEHPYAGRSKGEVSRE